MNAHALRMGPGADTRMQLTDNLLVSLGGGMSAVLAVALALLTFLRQRARPKDRKQLGGYGFQLGGVVVAGVYVVASASIAWWAFAEAVPPSSSLLLGISSHVWFGVLFAPPMAFGAILALEAAVDLVIRLIRNQREGWKP